MSASQGPGTRRTAQWPENSASSCGRGGAAGPPDTRFPHKHSLFRAAESAGCSSHQSARKDERLAGEEEGRSGAALPDQSSDPHGGRSARACGGRGREPGSRRRSRRRGRCDAPRGLARVFASPPVSGRALRPLRLPAGRLAGEDTPNQHAVPVTGTSGPRKERCVGTA